MTLLLCLCSGAWGNQTSLITDVTLPDLPASSLDMSSQTTYNVDANGWIVFDPYLIANNTSWWSYTNKSSQSQSFSADDLTALSPTAPFTAKTTTHFKINSSGSYAAAIRFTGAETISFLVHPRSATTNKEIYIALYSYDSKADPTQTQVGSIKKTSSNAFHELIFEDLSASNTYVAYVYGGSSGQNAALLEIALKKHVDTTPTAVTITSPASDPDMVEITQGQTTTLNVTATGYPAPEY